ncbi:MAG: UDP-4-amino-4,6-dideoxy-N-acetyl-beta-L-altrosamine transaminase [Saprospiraceae bacterium]
MSTVIPYGRQDISQADIDAVIEVLRSDFLTQGPVVPRFEQAIAAYCSVRHGVAVNSATSALHVACLALDLGPGDWLWTSPNTFVASANSGLYCGARVDFVDIDPRTYNMSVEALAVKLEQAEKSGCLPKVVIPVHFTGQPCDMPAIHKLSVQYGFKVIEDASHAIGASYDNVKVGSCLHSDITVFSFHPVKIITTGEGGMAMTNDEQLAGRMRRFRTHGITNDRSLMYERPGDEIWNYQQIDLGFNYRMTDIQAGLGLSQLSRLDEFLTRRHEIAHSYDEAFADLPIITPWQQPGIYSGYHLYPIRVRKSLCGKTQRQVFEGLLQHDIGVNLHYIPVHRQPYYENMGFKAGDYPEAELFHKEVISLPIYAALKEEQMRKVIQLVQGEFIK